LAKPAAKAIFNAYWVDGRDIGNSEVVAELCASVGAERQTVLQAIQGEEGSALLRAAVDRSLAKGVFGSPFFIIDGEPFFGLDKMELIEEWLATGGW
jgi:2-hydroxychromene-2-carboxylate isomerase